MFRAQTVDELVRFRATHPLKHTGLQGVEWEYIAAGRGSEALLILPGLLGIGEMSFQHIRAFEDDYRVIAPSYPFEITTMEQMTDGIVATILEAEGIGRRTCWADRMAGWWHNIWCDVIRSGYCRSCCRTPGGLAPIGRLPTVDSSRCCGLLPMSLLRFMLKGATRKSLKDAPEQIPFWEAYSNEMIARVSKVDLIGRYQVADRFRRTCGFYARRSEGLAGTHLDSRRRQRSDRGCPGACRAQGAASAGACSHLPRIGTRRFDCESGRVCGRDQTLSERSTAPLHTFEA